MLKALETPEQKRARRMAKKQEKLRRQRQKEGWNEDYLVSVWAGSLVVRVTDCDMLLVGFRGTLMQITRLVINTCWRSLFGTR